MRVCIKLFWTISDNMTLAQVNALVNELEDTAIEKLGDDSFGSEASLITFHSALPSPNKGDDK